uniref:VWFA domain-containing protein n=1 Tax=Poecilia formosa TaxID=48698 RepID=A0A096M7H2_POEFO
NKYNVLYVLKVKVLKAAVGFNVDSGSWKTLSQDDESFGYQVVQRQSDLLVSAPRLQYENNKTGRIFQCSTGGSCSNLPALEQRAAVNMSLGLAMAYDPSTQNTMVCGRTIPRDCASIAMYNGLCYEIDSNNTLVKSYPPATEECTSRADIAFLLDGSGSVSSQDFSRMKEFVKNLIRTFLDRDTQQFAITQFSHYPTTHYYFNTFRSFNWESQINHIRQFSGGTYTAGAIQNVVDDVFSPQRGSRSNVKRILIVITDGESHDRQNLPAATQSADQKNILRFAIGVGNAFTSTSAKQELRIIASQPDDGFVFQVGSFDALDKIRDNLQAKIYSIKVNQNCQIYKSIKTDAKQELRMIASQPADNYVFEVGSFDALDKIRDNLQAKIFSIKVDSSMGADLKPVSCYSMAVAKTNDGPLTILGAPRNQHKGVVMTAFNEQLRDQIRPFESQTGEYFGAEVCAMDVDSDGVTDLILISSPMYKDVDREGRVYVCELSRLVNVELFMLIYLTSWSSSAKGWKNTYNPSQITALRVHIPRRRKRKNKSYLLTGEQHKTLNVLFFNMSFIMHQPTPNGGWAGDLYPQPPFDAAQTSWYKKYMDDRDKARCFSLELLSNKTHLAAQAQVNFTLTLDANRKIPNNRAEISKDVRHKSGSLNLNLNTKECTDVDFFIESCPEDALNPLNNELRFMFDGLSSGSNPRPSLSPQVKTTTFHPVSKSCTS